MKVVFKRWRRCGVHGEREPTAGVGSRGKVLEAGGILISDDKTRLKLKNKSQMVNTCQN